MNEVAEIREGYKDSPLGKIPESWEVKRIEDVLKIGSGKDYKHLNEGDIPVYGTGGLMTHVDDFLYDGESVGIGRKGTIDKPVFLNGKFWTVDTLFYTYLFNNSLPKFIYYTFLTINWKRHNEASGVPSLSKTTIEKIKLILPPLPEQQKIAEILSTVDEKIEVIEEQITQTKELKKGLMQQLLKKGIGHTKFKDSPLGEIPESWEVKSILELGKHKKNAVQTGPFGGQLHSSDYKDEGTPFILIKNMMDNGVSNFDMPKISSSDAYRLKKYSLEINDVVFSRVGRVGSCFLVTEKEKGWIISGQLLRLRLPSDEINYKYLIYSLTTETSKNYLRGTSVGSTRQSINTKILESMLIPIPTISEQQKIAEILSSVSDKIDSLQEKKEEFKLLKKGLMQKLLTGKIRVTVD